MKRISFFLCFVLLSSLVRAQDAATTERLNKLDGLVQDLIEDKAATKKQLAEIAREIQSLREQLSKPSGNFASAEDLRKLAEAVKEIDKKRADDNEKIIKKIEKLGDIVAGGAKKAPKITVPPPDATGTNAAATDKAHFEYTIESGDTLDAIIKAYKEKGIKLTVDQILKANPGLNPNAMKVGKKIIIPAPQQ